MTEVERLGEFDPRIQTEPLGYSQSELIACECGRRNAPNRAACVYCGTALTAASTQLPYAGPLLDEWEKGLNLVTMDALRLPEISELLNGLALDSPLIAESCVPLARVADQRTVDTLASRLAALDMQCRVISDELFDLRNSPVRLSALEISGDEVTFVEFNLGRRQTVAARDVSLIVEGEIRSSKVESIEKRSKRTSTLVDENITDSREPVVDIYLEGQPQGYRIRPAGFDFSLLGERKELIASRNIEALLALLPEKLPGVRVDRAYAHLRSILDLVWPLRQRIDSLGERKIRFGKSGLARAVTATNLDQFTRYSRLQCLVR